MEIITLHLKFLVMFQFYNGQGKLYLDACGLAQKSLFQCHIVFIPVLLQIQ